LKALLLENIIVAAKSNFVQAGVEIESLPGSLPEAELIEKVRDISVLGIRSKTGIARNVLDSANALLAVGAFCIGIDQIDRAECNRRGIARRSQRFLAWARLHLGHVIKR